MIAGIICNIFILLSHQLVFDVQDYDCFRSIIMTTPVASPVAHAPTAALSQADFYACMQKLTDQFNSFHGQVSGRMDLLQAQLNANATGGPPPSPTASLHNVGDPDFFLDANFIKVAAPSWDGTDITKFHTFKEDTRRALLASMPAKLAHGQRGVFKASFFLRGAASDWYNSVYLTHPFLTFEDFFSRLGAAFGTIEQADLSRQKVLKLASKPWNGAYHSLFTVWSSHMRWIPDMDDKTRLDLFTMCLPGYLQDLICRSQVTTWHQAHAIISPYLTKKGLLDLSFAKSSSSSSPTSVAPMEIGAVTSKGKHAASAGKPSGMSAAEYWSDKLCPACNRLGHSPNFWGCTKHAKHVEYLRWAKSKASAKPGRAAAVESEQAPSPSATSAASTSAAPTYAAVVSASTGNTATDHLVADLISKLDQAHVHTMQQQETITRLLKE